MGGRGDGVAWRQISQMFKGWWVLQQSSAVLPVLWAGPSCLAGARIGGEEAQGLRSEPWGSPVGSQFLPNGVVCSCAYIVSWD